MDMKSTDLSARLLATENLSVVRGRVRTASFDIVNRVLTLPMWKDMTPEIEDMLVGHEVGHALYTGEKYMEPIKENTSMMSYLNVLEDVRIEKLIKRKYPGLRKRMNEGYKQLNERDFFGVQKVQNFDDLLLIDKINLYFKAGFQCGVSFDADEKVFVDRAERTETVEDVIELAKEVFEYSKQKAEEAKKQKMQLPQDSGGDEDEDENEGDFELDLDDMEEDDSQDIPQDKKAMSSPKPKPNPSKQEESQEVSDEELASKTERAFQDKLDDLADESTEYNYWKFVDSDGEKAVVGYKTILEQTKTPEQWQAEPDIRSYPYTYMSEEEYSKLSEKLAHELNQFKTESMRTVNYLVKEFEMKKSATLHKRAQVSKIGSLDMRKVYAYKLKDDLFKRVTTLPQGKNHGMIMLVDWSGSMGDVIEDTLKQVINLAMFCNRIQIPYRVLAFTSHYSDRRDYEVRVAEARKTREIRDRLAASGENYINCSDSFHLLELLSSKMSTSEFNTMVKRLVDPRFRWNDGYDLGGTPLNEGLVWCYQNIGSYIKSNQIEKMTLITLTDGEGSPLYALNRNSLDSYRNGYDSKGGWARIKTKHFIRDDLTQKTYEFTRDSAQQASTILQMTKDRYDISVVGFHICINRRGDLKSFMRSALPGYAGDTSTLVEAWRKEFRDNGFASVKNTGRDDLFLIPQSSTKIVEGDLEVDSDASAKSIARNFSKYLNVKKTSRVLLNRFVTLVA